MTRCLRLLPLNSFQPLAAEVRGVLLGKVAHFSGRSSCAKMADTGQAGTQAPQSMHSTGSMKS
jgi:hypothetical protein